MRTRYEYHWLEGGYGTPALLKQINAMSKEGWRVVPAHTNGVADTHGVLMERELL